MSILQKSVVGSKIRRMHLTSTLCKSAFADVARGESDERIVVLQVMYLAESWVVVEYIDCE